MDWIQSMRERKVFLDDYKILAKQLQYKDGVAITDGKDLVEQIQENPGFSATHTELETPLRHLNGTAEQAGKYMSLEVRGESWLVT